MISLERRRASKKEHKQKIIEQRDTILKEIRNMNAEAKRIRTMPRDEIDALITETVGEAEEEIAGVF